MARDIRLDIAADPSLLCAVRGLVRSYVANFGFPKERVDEVVLAVDEACTNSIRHAYGGPCDKDVQISLSSSNGWLEFEVRDGGTPAPADAVRPREACDHAPDLDKITPGGLGVQLIHRVFDQVEFCSGATEGNCVLMKLKRPQEDSS